MICQNCGQEFTVTPTSDSKKFCPKCFIQKLNHLANHPDPVATKPMDDPMQPITDTGTGQPPVEPTTPPVDPTPPAEGPIVPPSPITPPAEEQPVEETEETPEGVEPPTGQTPPSAPPVV